MSASDGSQLHSWIVDSGATCRMCNDGDLFVELHSFKQPLVGFTVVCSYRISLGNAKDEDLKELWHDLSSKKANF